MASSYYFVIGIIAIFIHLIINFDVFRKFNTINKNLLSYQKFVIAVLSYYVTDVLWGVVNSFGFVKLLYIDTIFYYIAMSLSVVSWCFYVIDYLNLKNSFGKIIKIFGIVFCGIEAFVIIINIFIPIFFIINENGEYKALLFRYISLGIQMLLFGLISFQAGFFAIKKHSEYKSRNITISLFSFAMIITVLVQNLFPLLPIYSIGFMVGTCFLHVFIQEDEKDEFRKTLQEKTEIIENAGYGIWRISISDNGKKKMICDDKLQRTFGIENMNLTPEETYEYYHSRLQEDVREIEEDDYKSMFNGFTRARLLCWNHPEKGDIYLRAGGTKHISTFGEKFISGYCGDITEQKLVEDKLNARLEEAKRQAEIANKAKSKFLFSMSHDIRTPMNAIIGFTTLLENHLDDEEKIKDYIDKIRSSSSFLLSLINNVLEVARIESGKVSLNETLSKVGDISTELRAVFYERMKQKNIDFIINFDFKTKFIYVDKVKLNEIFLNLISNAYKYTKSGGTVSLLIKELPCDKEGFCKMQTTISDTGIGMSKDFLPHLFEDFSREKTFTEGKIEGTGLGMPIVKNLVNLMNGTIEVESELGKGTKFTIVLTHKIATPQEIESKQKENEKIDTNIFLNKRILLAEDNDLNSEIAIELLSSLGFKVDRAVDGIDCVKTFKKTERKYYDLILMDIQMPNMNGYEATKEIRNFYNQEKANIPIIAMTANAFEEDKKEAFDAGMNGHIAKPINIKELVKEISRFLK